MSLVLAIALAASAVGDAPLRVVVGEVALRQVAKPDASWQPAQRDCAGLVRHAYREAFKQLRPARLATPLWNGLHFADAQTLVTSGSFTPLGRSLETRRALETGDVLAFRQEPGEDGEPRWHLMLVVRTQGPVAGDALVVYHPGSPGAAVRMGRLEELARDAPAEWRPDPDNRFFLGYFRFKEWMP